MAHHGPGRQRGGVDTRRTMTAGAVALPGMALAGAGLTHPTSLTVSSAHSWWQLHVWLLPLFPLLAGALAVLLHGDRTAVAMAARTFGYGFAIGYTALDVLDGIGAGLVVDTGHRPVDAVVLRLFQIGDRLGRAGICSLVACAVLTAIALWPRHGPWVLPGAIVFVIGCWGFWYHHIFHPRGVESMLALAAGTVMLAVAPRRRGRPDGASVS